MVKKILDKESIVINRQSRPGKENGNLWSIGELPGPRALREIVLRLGLEARNFWLPAVLPGQQAP